MIRRGLCSVFYCPPASSLCHLYVASAVYADRAGSADTASNALKLGGYDASDYLRKDEVQTVTAAYQEIEWTTPGTYDWVVPEGTCHDRRWWRGRRILQMANSVCTKQLRGVFPHSPWRWWRPS